MSHKRQHFPGRLSPIDRTSDIGDNPLTWPSNTGDSEHFGSFSASQLEVCAPVVMFLA